MCFKFPNKTSKSMRMFKFKTFLGIITLTKLVLVLGQISVSSVLENVSLQFTGLSNCVINLQYFNTHISPVFWNDLASYIIQNNLNTVWIIDDDSSPNGTVFPDFEHGKLTQIRGRCAITIIINLFGSDTKKRNVLMETHPNLAVGTYTHSTLLLVSLEFPNQIHLVPLDKTRTVRSFFILLLLTQFSTQTSASFLKDYHFEFEMFYICPYCATSFVPLRVSPNLRKIGIAFPSFQESWSPVSYEFNYKPSTYFVKDCNDIRAKHGYSCRIDVRRVATLTKILNVSTVPYNPAAELWRYGDIQLRSFAFFYPNFMLNGLLYQREKG